MKTHILISLIFVFFSLGTYAQKTSDLPINKEFQKAVANKTRTTTGNPGVNYFINKTDYKIVANFNPETRLLSGNETITYTNNSNDTLKYLVFNLYQDIFKKGNARDWDLGTIQIKWDFILPGTVAVRNGTYEDDNFFIAYWYPKIAVYDDIIGWNNRGYSGRYEFYNDFGDFDVEITVPSAYNVWATGVQQNYSETYTNKYVKRINKAHNSSKTINIITKEDRENNSKITLNKKDLVWKFQSEQTPDFSFAVSKTYFWDGIMADGGNKKVFINTVYKPKSESYKEVAQITKEIIEYFSTKIPAIRFPYSQMTIFNGGGGMEFPGMVNDGTPKQRSELIYLTAHEIGHSYFPFYTGLNEQKYAWMDEGLITFFPTLAAIHIAKDSTYKPIERNVQVFNYFSHSMDDMPLNVLSENTGRYAYRFHAYSKPAMAFYILYNYLGEEKFVKGLQVFTEKWNGKHPLPLDFFNAFNNAAGEDLAWFWKPWFFSLKYTDLKISSVKNDGDYTVVEITNVGGLPLPIILTTIDENNNEEIIYRQADIWKNNTDKYIIKIKKSNYKKIMLDTELTPDVNSDNNVFKN